MDGHVDLPLLIQNPEQRIVMDPVHHSPATTTSTAPSERLSWAWVPVAAIIIVMFYPGIMSKDSLAALEQARTFEFTDWHPPIMSIIWASLDRIVEGPGLMLVAQAVLYAVAAGRLCAEAFPALMRRLSPWLVVPIFALFPPVMALNGMIWKDVWMSGLLLLALAYLFRLSRRPDGRTAWRAFAVVVVSCLLATAFRHNAVGATAGLLAGACYFLLPRWHVLLRLLAAGMAGLALAGALVMTVTGVHRLVAEPAKITSAILIHDIAGIIVHSGEPKAAARHALTLAPALTKQPGRFLRRIRTTYDPAQASRVQYRKNRPNAPYSINVFKPDHDAESIETAWKGLIQRYPVAYLKHRYEAFLCLMQLCTVQGWANHSYVLNERFAFPDSPALPQPQHALRQVFLNPALVRLYMPAFWLALALIAGVIGLALCRTRHVVAFFMSLSALGLAVSLFFTSPIESYRYVHWIILVGWIAVWMALDLLIMKKASVQPPASN